MPKSTDIRLTEATVQTERIDYRTPIKFGGRVVTDAVMVNVGLEVETRDGRRGSGSGSMPMGNVWAWPSSQVDADATLAAMTRLAQHLVDVANDFNELGHPLEITHALEPAYSTCAQEVTQDLPEGMPQLAQLVSASPLEAAIHDAYGKVHRQSAYNVLGEAWANQDLGKYLGDEFTGEYVDDYTLREPKPEMPL